MPPFFFFSSLFSPFLLLPVEVIESGLWQVAENQSVLPNCIPVQLFPFAVCTFQYLHQCSKTCHLLLWVGFSCVTFLAIHMLFYTLASTVWYSSFKVQKLFCIARKELCNWSFFPIPLSSLLQLDIAAGSTHPPYGGLQGSGKPLVSLSVNGRAQSWLSGGIVPSAFPGTKG